MSKCVVVLAVIIFFLSIFFGTRWILRHKPKKKQYLVCPKTGIAEVDPDGKTPCTECAKEYTAQALN